MSHTPDLGPLASRTFAAVLFDMDGTLIDSMPAVERSWHTWAAEYGISDDEMVSTHGLPAAQTTARLIAPEKVDEALARINELELTDLEGVTPLPGAAEALAALSDSRRAIATSCSRDLFEVRIAYAGLPKPAVQVTVDDVERGKPAPDPFLKAAELLGVDPTECLVIEDAPGGLKGARAAGCATLAVSTWSKAADLDADAVVSNLADVVFTETADGVTVALAG